MSWRDDVKKEMNDSESIPYLNLEDGESVELVFVDEGTKKHDSKFKRDMIEFQVNARGRLYKWDVSMKAYSVLDVIMGMGETITGRSGVLRRNGEGLETRWSFTPTPEKGE